jgi:hypothetical protein
VEEGLKIILAADDSQLQITVARAVQTTTAGLHKMQASVALFGGGVRALNPVVQRMGQGLSTIPATANRAAAALQNVNRAGGASVQTLSNISRVAQDAPYGFIGIANNINPLVESFQRLRVETGGNKAAFKALAGSLMGPAGIGLAVGVASSLLVTFGDQLFKAKKATEDAKEAAKEYKDAVEGIFQNVAKEAADTGVLVAALKSEVTTRNEKIAALKELKSINPEIFGQLKLEGETVRGLDAAYQSYIQNLRTVIAVQVKRLQLENVTKQILEREGVTLTKSQKEAVNILKSFNAENQKQIATGNASVVNLQKQGQLQDKQYEGQKELNNLYEDQKTLLGEIAELGAGIKVKTNVELEKGGKKDFAFLESFFGFDPNGKLSAKQEAEIVKAADNFYKKFGELFTIPNFLATGTPLKIAQEFNKLWQKGAEAIPKDIQLKAPKLLIDFSQIPEVKDGIKIPLKFDAQFDQAELIASIEEAMDKIKTAAGNVAGDLGDEGGQIFADKYNAKLQVAIGKGVAGPALDKFKADLNKQMELDAKLVKAMADMGTDVAAAFGEGLGDAFTGGIGDGIRNTLSSIFEILGGIISKMGVELIVASKAVIAFKAALASLFKNPVGGLALGIGLVAIGQIMKNVGASIPKFADGGIVSGPTLGLMGEYAGAKSNPEVIAPLSKLKDLIKGSSNTSNVNVTGMFRVQGTDLVLALEREYRSQGRTR